MTLDGAGSTDPDGTIAKYEWDLDGNGTYETDTGTTPTTTHQPTRPRAADVGLRVTDNGGATATTTRTVTSRTGPDRLLHRHAQPGHDRHQPVSFDASASSDPDGTIAKYEWDLDGNGSYETNTGTTPTTTTTYADRRRPSPSACG